MKFNDHILDETVANASLSKNGFQNSRKMLGLRSLVLAMGLIVPFAGTAMASTFECPAVDDLPATKLQADIDTLLPAGDLLDQPEKLYEAAALLREHGMSDGNTVNHLIARYCPSVANNSSLTDQEKTDRVRYFANEAAQLVSQQDETVEIIYTVKLEPDLAERVENYAAKEGTSAENWIKKAVEEVTK